MTRDRDLRTLSEGELLEVRVEEVQYEANVWGNVTREIDDIVGLVGGLRLTRETFDPHFFGEAVRLHSDIAQKVQARCTEGAAVTKKIQTLLEAFTEHYRSLAVRGGRTLPPARALPAPAPEPPPSEWRDNFRAQLGIPSQDELETILKRINERVTELGEKLKEFVRIANEQLERLEWWFWQSWHPRAAILTRIIRTIVPEVLDKVGFLLQVVNFVVQQARLTIAMYDDSIKWVAMRNKANDVATWLSTNVLNPERGYPPEQRQQAWTGRPERVYAAAIPAQKDAASSIALMSLVTGGSLMGCYGAQVYVFSTISSSLVDVIKLIGDIGEKIVRQTIVQESFSLAWGALATWVKNIKENGLAMLMAEGTSKYTAEVMRMLVRDNTAFAYRADMQLYSSVRQLPVAWPDPTRRGAPWPREGRNARGERTWEVNRDLAPAPVQPVQPGRRRR